MWFRNKKNASSVDDGPTQAGADWSSSIPPHGANEASGTNGASGSYDSSSDSGKDSTGVSSSTQADGMGLADDAVATSATPKSADPSVFYVGKCCTRPSCFFATKKTVMHYCPYCASELTEVYDYFAMLGIETETFFSKEQLARHYKTRSKQFHPDTSSEFAEFFHILGEAYKTLADITSREKYQLLLKRCYAALEGSLGKEDPLESTSDEKPEERIFFKLNMVLATITVLGSAFIAYALGGAMPLFLTSSLAIGVVFALFHQLYRVFSGIVVITQLCLFFYFFLNQQWVYTATVFLCMLVSFLGFAWLHKTLLNKTLASDSMSDAKPQKAKPQKTKV